MPKVSVWLTSYNHGQFIRESIESILDQTYTDFELYIVDDCSSDNSWEIIQEYTERDSRIRAIRHSYNQGDSGMYSMLSELHGEYIAIAHCDDAWMPSKLEKQVKVLDTSDDVVACFTLVDIMDDNGQLFVDESHPYVGLFEQNNRTRYEWLNRFFYSGNCLCHPSLLIRKDAYMKYNLITKGLNGLPDFCKWIRICRNGEIHILQEHLTRFRVHIDGLNTSGENARSINRLNTEEWLVLKEYESLIADHMVTKVFPDARQYIVNGEICEKYALAQIMINHVKNSYKLYGLQMLYELFQVREQEEKLSRLYGYTKKSYNLDKQKYDIFNDISENRYLKVSAYLSYGENYDEANKVTTTAFVQRTGAFVTKIDLCDYPVEVLKKLRVDLDEGRYRKFKIVKCVFGNRQVQMIPINGQREGEWDVFYTIDPQYEIKLNQSGCLYIEGYTEEIMCGEVEQHFNEMQQQCSELAEEIERMKNSKIWKIGTGIKRLFGRL